MEISKKENYQGYEWVVFASDDKTNFKAIIAVHSTELGPALGGCRMWFYNNENEALTDVLRLAEGMTYKNSAMGLNLGGGKAVIIGDPRTDKSPELFARFAEAVNSLGGKYYTAEDVGISPADMLEVYKHTPYVVGLPAKSGDPSPFTAYGVYVGMKAAVEEAFGDTSLEGKKVAVQGLGHVGMYLLEHLYNEGAKLIVTDIFTERVKEAVERFGALPVEPEKIYEVEADIFAPCALGAILNENTIPRLKVKVIAGAANNQLAKLSDGFLLRDRGIVYAPDFIINGGGVINVAEELNPEGYDKNRVWEKVATIYHKVKEVLTLAREQNISPQEAAIRYAKKRLNR
ncbi:Glu/Leu/Phe/Val family dehydrogenase [Carboxydothermus pertinax]|uniref:Leucine dehydrogenase n=1 Tax=Carboxydothermus pertinax TaxID=870242 RepID=A0A1L8CTI5_9THEO|nr:Glu/Leu/Phe/Val dehydrogenase [Carboxydothermus pertinax]GAV22231.1 leucine dehydrogenase [Carboxydothermus pertinax]